MNLPSAGIILAGGQSSRMGRNKALLDFRGQPLYQHMQELLKCAGLSSVYISGDIQGTANCLVEPVAHQGPARALAYVAQQLMDKHAYMLVVPVDMPLLSVDLLQVLLTSGEPCHYSNHPLPALLRVGPIAPDIYSMHALLAHQQARVLMLAAADSGAMRNFNTPEEWAELS